MNFIKTIGCGFVFLLANLSWSQSHYNGINLQGQLLNESLNQVDFRVLIYGSTNDTIWMEEHVNVVLSEQKSFHFVLGFGINTTGSSSSFSDIDWTEVNHLEIHKINGLSSYQISVLNILPQPYAFHSKYLSEVPSVLGLSDVSITSLSSNNCIKYNGVAFDFSQDNVGDSIGFAFYSNMSQHSDTVNFAIMNGVIVDSSSFAYYTNNSNFALNSFFASSSDSANYADSVSNTLFAINNWGLSGNSGLSSPNYLGTNDAQMMSFKTNSSLRMNIGVGNEITNTSGLNGFGFYSATGLLIVPNNSVGFSTISGSFLYFSGAKSAFIGGENNTSMDTSIALGSFSWGLNISTKGQYGTMFGLNSFADSTKISGIDFSPDATFVLGKNCTGGLYCIAIGDSASASFNRNVAIGKNVYAMSQSSSIAIGNNVISSGATAWAIGKNLTATAHFTTALGTNASTGSFLGGFVYGDLSTNSIVTPNAIHQFVVRAAGGYVFYTASDLSMGVELLPGAGSWNMISDKNKKENIHSLDYSIYSQKYLRIPIYSWVYKGQNTLHIGPMAQDFEGIFNVGEYTNYINMVDIDGVIILGVKQLDVAVKDELKTQEVLDLEKNIELEKMELEKLNNRIKLLYEKINP